VPPCRGDPDWSSLTSLPSLVVFRRAGVAPVGLGGEVARLGAHRAEVDLPDRGGGVRDAEELVARLFSEKVHRTRSPTHSVRIQAPCLYVVAGFVTRQVGGDAAEGGMRVLYWCGLVGGVPAPPSKKTAKWLGDGLCTRRLPTSIAVPSTYAGSEVPPDLAC